MLAWIQNFLGMDAPKSTLSDILREAPKWLEVTAEREHLTKAKCGEQAQLEAALAAWLSEVGAKGSTVGDLALVKKARTLGDSLGEDPSSFGSVSVWVFFVAPIESGMSFGRRCAPIKPLSSQHCGSYLVRLASILLRRERGRAKKEAVHRSGRHVASAVPSAFE